MLMTVTTGRLVDLLEDTNRKAMGLMHDPADNLTIAEAAGIYNAVRSVVRKNDSVIRAFTVAMFPEKD